MSKRKTKPKMISGRVCSDADGEVTFFPDKTGPVWLKDMGIWVRTDSGEKFWTRQAYEEIYGKPPAPGKCFECDVEL